MNAAPPTNRIEAFSDGVIAIIITIMVFDLKLPELPPLPSDSQIWAAWLAVLPKFLAYTLSFVVVGIMWINHHLMFHQMRHSTSGLVWFNAHLLFWMSLIPLPTQFLANQPFAPQASFFYALILGMNALSFTLLRLYASRSALLPAQHKVNITNFLSVSLYGLAAGLAFVSVYAAFAIFVLVPTLYFLPEKLMHSPSSNT